MTNQLLGRTASGLFWMMRYLERMENTSRIVEAGFRMSLTRSRTPRSEWESVLATTGSKPLYLEHHKEYRSAEVVEFLLSDPDNPGSVISSMSAARRNARMARTALTRDVWEAINGAWLQISSALKQSPDRAELPERLSLIRQQSALVRGTIGSTMLRNEIYQFIQLGALIERADNTARILDTKYYVLLPSSASVGSSLDHVQWEMILRSASASRAFNWLYGGDTSPRAIVDFLVHDVRLPRSIAFCYSGIEAALSELDDGRDKPQDLLKRCREIGSSIETSTADTIIGGGLHDFLLGFISDNAAMSAAIADTFRFDI